MRSGYDITAALPCYTPGVGGTPIHYLYGYVLPNGVVILKPDLELNGVSISEAFSRSRIFRIFRTQECSSSVSSHLKLFKVRLLLKIRFNALTRKLLYSCCNLCFILACKGGGGGAYFGASRER